MKFFINRYTLFIRIAKIALHELNDQAFLIHTYSTNRSFAIILLTPFEGLELFKCQSVTQSCIEQSRMMTEG